MRRYRGLLRTSVAARLILASVVARFPLGMTALALILLVQREFGGFGTAGLLTGCFGIANGLGAPVRGRCVDRFGPVVLLLLTGIRDVGLGDRCREARTPSTAGTSLLVMLRERRRAAQVARGNGVPYVPLMRRHPSSCPCAPRATDRQRRSCVRLAASSV
jgi:hypothetical protein